MKQILLFAVLALLAIPAVGQTVVTDSTIIFQTDSTYFQTRYVIRDNGESEVITTRIGDSTTAQNFLFNQANDAAKDFTVCANRVLNINKDRNKIRDLAQALQTAVGVDYFALSRELNYLTFVDTIGVDKAWQWRVGATTPVITALNIRKLPNGGQLRIGGLPGISGANRNINFMGPGWIRIQNYPTGVITNLYEFVPGRWFNIERSIELRLTGLQIKPGQ